MPQAKIRSGSLCKLVTPAAIMLIGLMAPSAMADWRSYVWTYEYQTLRRGESEFESYLTFSSPEADRMKGITTAEHQLELEIGMTDRYDFSIYQVFKQAPGGELEYDEFKLRSRYRFGEKGRYAVDPLIYVEYIGKPDFAEHELELKLVIARDLGRLNFAANPILEFGSEEDWEAEAGYAVGASYRLGSLLKIGLESKGSEDGYYLGPVLSHGRQDLWATLGTAFAVSDVKEGVSEFQLRMLIGVGL